MNSSSNADTLACLALSQSALPLARRLAERLAEEPWPRPRAVSPGTLAGSMQVQRVRLFAPARFCPPQDEPFSDLGALLAQIYPAFPAHVFIGAAGIAVRALAPLLTHKSADSPVLVLDPAGRYVVSLLSGHWGGGNDLARHVARLLGAAPVITTASDTAANGDNLGTPTENAPPALDILLRDAGLRPVDWDCLPAAQAALLEGKQLHVWDPCRAVPEHPSLVRLPAENADTPPPAGTEGPLAVAHWKLLPPDAATLRVAVPRLFVGLGCRSGVSPALLEDAVRRLLAEHGLEPLAVAALATVTAKVHEPALQALAASLHVPLQSFAAEVLAGQTTPNPSIAAGKRFGLPPFSVCEAAALLAAERAFMAQSARLLMPKVIVRRQITMAVAISDRKSL